MRLRKTIAFCFLLLIILAMCSCSASWHIKTAKRKDPSLFEKVEKIDTLLIETKAIDTVFKQVKDTVIEYVQKESNGGEVRIKYLYNTVTDSVYIEADCPDQEVITKTVTETVTLKPTLWEKLQYSAVFLVILLIILALRRIT